MNSPFFSIIIPTFNRQKTLKRAIDSVLSQSYSDYELIIVDDGSSDNTKGLADQYNERLTYIYQDNKGVSAARNRGVIESSGKWLAFLDSDDEWYSNKLDTQFNQINNSDLFLFHSDEDWIRDNIFVNKMAKHKKGGGDQFLNSLKQCFISPSTVCIKSDIFKELGMFDEDFLVCEDYDLWLKFTSLYEIGYCESSLIKKYGGHEDQLSMKYFAMDFFRVQTIDWILKNRQLKNAYKELAISTLLKKCDRLIKGYVKHNNLSDLPFTESLYKEYLESK